MPNTFSMAPRYVRDFAARTSFASPDRDVFDCLEKKLSRLYRQAPPQTPGLALLGDARDAGPRARVALRERGLPDRARLVVTSPPYLRVVKYGYYNWLRRGCWASTPGRSMPASTMPTTASHISCSFATSWPVCDPPLPTTRSSSS